MDTHDIFIIKTFRGAEQEEKQTDQQTDQQVERRNQQMSQQLAHGDLGTLDAVKLFFEGAAPPRGSPHSRLLKY
jgi:hypothetical protein